MFGSFCLVSHSISLLTPVFDSSSVMLLPLLPNDVCFLSLSFEENSLEKNERWSLSFLSLLIFFLSVSLWLWIYYIDSVLSCLFFSSTCVILIFSYSAYYFLLRYKMAASMSIWSKILSFKVNMAFAFLFLLLASSIKDSY